MKLFFGLIALTFLQWSFSQNISLKEIWSFKFYPKSLDEIVPMKDGEHYTVLDIGGLEKYSFENFEKKERLVSGFFSGYIFSEDESLVLLETQPKPIYRRSKKASYAIYNIEKDIKWKVFDGKSIREPLLSPDNKKVAFVFDNNIYIQYLDTKIVESVTRDGELNKIINGITDWVYEEEFAFVRAFDWSPNGRSICFLRFNETDVPEMTLIKGEGSLYPKTLAYKYPKAGEQNAKVSVHWYDLSKKKTYTVAIKEYPEPYIPLIQFGKKPHAFYIATSNRYQNKISLIEVNTQKGKQKKILEETDDAYVETDNLLLEFLDDGSFVWQSEKNGFRHLYLHDDQGKQIQQLTQGDFEVSQFYGFDQAKQKLYYQSSENGSNNRGIYSIDLKNMKKMDLATDSGYNEATFSSNFKYFVNQYSSLNSPPIFTLNNGGSGEIIKEILNNDLLSRMQKEEKISKVELMEIEVGEEKLNAFVIKPKDFNPQKKHPLLMSVYGGPGSQETMNKWDPINYWWFQHLAQKGVIVACVDGRGTGGKGRDFKKSTYLNLGKKETQDQINAAKYFSKLDYIDKSKIGIFGWSFGGYLSLLALEKGADVFEMAISVAPVTNWRFYDTIYTERFLRTPSENPLGYDQNSPIEHTDKIKGELLLIHGTMDDNVHVQNTYEMVESLVENNIDFDLMIYPDKNHGIFGGNTRLHLYKNMDDFIDKTLLRK